MNCCHDCLSLFLNCCDSANAEKVSAAVRTQSHLRIRRYLRQGFDVNTLLQEYDTTLLYASVSVSDTFSDLVKQFHESLVIEYNPSNSVNGMGQNGLMYYLLAQKRRVQECLRFEDLVKIYFLVHQCDNQVLQADTNGNTPLAVSINMLKTDDVTLCDRLLHIYETCRQKELKRFKDIALLKRLVRESCEHFLYLDIAEINKIGYSERMYKYIKLKCALWLMKCSTVLQGTYVRDMESHHQDCLYSMAIKVFYLMSHFVDESGSYTVWKEDYVDYTTVLQEMIFIMTKKNDKLMNSSTTIELPASIITGSDVLTTANENLITPRQQQQQYYMVTRNNFQWMLCVGPLITYSMDDLRKIYCWATMENLWLPLDFREEFLQSNSMIMTDERKEQQETDDDFRSSSISSITMSLALMSMESQTVSTPESAQKFKSGRRSNKKSSKSSSKYRKRLSSKSVMNAIQNKSNACYQLNKGRFTAASTTEVFNDLPFLLLVKVNRMLRIKEGGEKARISNDAGGVDGSNMFQISLNDERTRDIFHLLTDHVFTKMTNNNEESYRRRLGAVNEASTSRNLLSIAFEFKEFSLVSYLVGTLKIDLSRALMPISKQVVCSDGYGEPTKVVYQPAPIYDLLRIDDRTGIEGIQQIWNFLENHAGFQAHLRAQYTYRVKGSGIQAYMTSMPCKNVRLDDFIHFQANGRYPLAWKIYPTTPVGYFIREMTSYYTRIDYSREVDYSLALNMTSQYQMKIWNRFQETSNCIDMQNKILWNCIIDMIMLNNASAENCRSVLERLIKARLFQVHHDADNSNNNTGKENNDVSIDPSIVACIFYPNCSFEKALTMMRFLLFGDQYPWQDEIRAHVRADNKVAWAIIKSAVQSDKYLSPQLMDFLKSMLFEHSLLNLTKCSWVLLGFFELLHYHPNALAMIRLIRDNVQESVWLSMLDRSNRLCRCGPHFNIPYSHEAEKRIKYVGKNFIYLAGSILQVAGLNLDEDLVLYLLKEGSHPQANTFDRKQVPADFKYQHNIAENVALGDTTMTEVNMDLLPCLWIGYFRAFARREATNMNTNSTDGSTQDALFVKFKKLCLVAIACEADACDINEELLLFCAATTLSYKIPLADITEFDLKPFLRCYDTILRDDLLCTTLAGKGATVERKDHPTIIKEILNCTK